MSKIFYGGPMTRVEFLKKFVAFNKKHNVPLWLIKAQLYVILVVCFIHYAIVKGINGVKYAMCYPFIKTKEYIQKHIRTICMVECVVATICVVVLVIGKFDGISLDNSRTGALAGETPVQGEIMGGNNEVLDDKSEHIHDIVSGSVSNDETSNDVQEETENVVENQTEAETETENGDGQANENLLPYKIMVNRLANCVTIYIPDENGEYTVPYKAMICSTGGENTPAGTFNLKQKYDFKALFYNSYGQYCSRIQGAILFHSSGNNSLNKDDLNAGDFNNLGLGVSHGCIRLTVEDAKWIHDNCPTGTEVVIYDSEEPGPLGKPKCIKVPAGTKWDPTDPDENNPWNDKMPRIEGAVNKVVYELDNFDYLSGIKAYDTCGNDITSEIIVTGEVDLNIPGEYIVTYSVTDLLGRSAECTVIYSVR